MPRSRMVLSSVLVVVLGMGVGVAVERSHGEGRHAPGMGIIAGTARKTPVLFQILRGQVPATIEQSVTFADPTGRVTTYQPQGATATDGNAFFSSDITTNGRTCFTCHQPQNGWEISPPQIAAQLVLTRGRSALFQPIDAADCPSSPGAMARSRTGASSGRAASSSSGATSGSA